MQALRGTGFLGANASANWWMYDSKANGLRRLLGMKAVVGTSADLPFQPWRMAVLANFTLPGPRMGRPGTGGFKVWLCDWGKTDITPLY